MNQEIRWDGVIGCGEASDLLVDVEAMTLNDKCFGKIRRLSLSETEVRTKDHVDYREEDANARIYDDFASFLSPCEYIARGDRTWDAPPRVLVRLLGSW